MGSDASDRGENHADGTMLWSCTGLEDHFALDLGVGEIYPFIIASAYNGKLRPRESSGQEDVDISAEGKYPTSSRAGFAWRAARPHYSSAIAQLSPGLLPFGRISAIGRDSAGSDHSSGRAAG
jgi:hypothetical protein